MILLIIKDGTILDCSLVLLAVVCRGAVAMRQQNQLSVNEFELTLSELSYAVTRILTGRIKGLRRRWHWYRQQLQQYNANHQGIALMDTHFNFIVIVILIVYQIS
mmetsp:Transcript_27484/g.29651  ORF Transcript_27484/g.29651 Transcript_27484/m.29651 type:complete len:105 (-) Transcript_27484:719-1033(-)